MPRRHNFTFFRAHQAQERLGERVLYWLRLPWIVVYENGIQCGAIPLLSSSSLNLWKVIHSGFKILVDVSTRTTISFSTLFPSRLYIYLNFSSLPKHYSHPTLQNGVSCPFLWQYSSRAVIPCVRIGTYRLKGDCLLGDFCGYTLKDIVIWASEECFSRRQFNYALAIPSSETLNSRHFFVCDFS